MPKIKSDHRKPKPKKQHKPNQESSKKTIIPPHKNEATISTFASRSDPDRVFRMNRIKNKNSNLYTDYRYSSDAINQKLCPKIKLSLKPKNMKQDKENCEGLISFRQYMMINQEWYPVLNSSQRSKLLQISPQENKEKQIKILKNQQTQYSPRQQNLDDYLKKVSEQLSLRKPHKEANFQQNQQYRKRIHGYVMDIVKSLEGPFAFKELTETISKGQTRNNHHQKNVLQTEVQGLSCQQKSPIKQMELQFRDQDIDGKKGEPELQNIEEMINYREFCQLGYSHQQINHQGINTNAIAISSFIQFLFDSLINSQYLPEIIKNISYAHGYQKLKKYTRISRCQELTNNLIPIIPEFFIEQIIENFLAGNGLQRQAQKIHAKCLLDAINDELSKLKPYHKSIGENFPWSFKLSAPITFYDIDQQSLPIVFVQTKQKILTKSANLCGLLVDVPAIAKMDAHKNQAFECLLKKRREYRQNHMIQKFLTSERWSLEVDNQTQFESIKIMNSISGEIFQNLIKELILQPIPEFC